MTIGHIISNLRTKKFSQEIQSIFRILTPFHVIFLRKERTNHTAGKAVQLSPAGKLIITLTEINM